MDEDGMTDDAAMAALMGTMERPSEPEEEDDNGAEDLHLEENEDDDSDFDDDDDAPDDDAGGDEQGGSDDASGQQPAAAAIADDAVVKIAAEDGTEQEYTVAQLKQFATESAQVQQYQQVTAQRAQQTAFFLQNALNEVMADVQPYENVDWLVLQNQMAPEEFAWHRENHAKAATRLEKLRGSFSQMEQMQAQRAAEQLQRDAQASLKVLKDPTQGIQGWNDELYGEITKFAVEAGLPQDEVNKITNPNVIKIINDARLYRQAQKAQPTKKNLTANNVRREAGDQQLADTKTQRLTRLQRKVRSGNISDGDATALLASRL